MRNILINIKKMRSKIKFLSKDDVKVLKRCLVYIKPYKKKFCVFMISILTVIIFGIIQPLIWGKILQCLAEKDYKSIYINLIYTFILLLLKTIVEFIKSYSESELNNNLAYDLKADMYYKILNLPMKIFDNTSIGDLISRLQGDVFTLSNIITNQLVNAVLDILRVLIVGIAIFKINIILSLIVLGAFPLSYLIFAMFGKKLRKENEKIKKLNDRYFSLIQQSLLGIKHIKTFGAKNSNYKDFNKISGNMRDKQIEVNLLETMSFTFSNIVNFLDEFVVILIGIYFIYKQKLSIQYFVAFISYSSQFSNSLSSITRLNSSIQQALVSLERIFELIDNFTFSIETFGNKEVGELDGNIEFKNVSFSYEESKKILRNISFSIPKNKFIAVVGKNGCGKTTIYNLLLGLYKVDKGEILIDGININDFSEDSLRKNISVVHQQPFLFNLSIYENMRIAVPNASNDEIEKGCKQVFIHDYIMSLENKYDTVIAEEGSNLSGGQKQRLALAMCMLRKASIVLLDEATSALDTESRYFVRKSINHISKSTTVIIITHHLATILDADEIIVIDNGKVAAKGFHEDLLKTSIIYREIYEHEIASVIDEYEVDTSLDEISADIENETV
ncbi:MAG: ABC transporter ATP-binding protein [Clostridium sp.]|uniref:ABC transporter ATP-binding protein n=1 Tax=Clostridium sp. TaxID=1506 RepID=UPI003D6CD0F6